MIGPQPHTIRVLQVSHQLHAQGLKYLRLLGQGHLVVEFGVRDLPIDLPIRIGLGCLVASSSDLRCARTRDTYPRFVRNAHNGAGP